MSQLSALFKKELIELVGDRSSRRGGFVQGVVMIAVLGVALPYSHAAAWVAGSVVPAFFFGLLPGIPAVVLAADAIAGERERRTLPTLLASPIRESTLLFGKWLAAVAYGSVVALASLVAAILVVSATTGAFVPAPILIAGSLFAGVASSAFMASVAVLVSMKLTSARASQQVASILSLALAMGLTHLATTLGLSPTWPVLFAASATGLALSAALLIVGANLFRRERLLEPG